MFADPKKPKTNCSRRDAEAKLIDCRNKFLGYLRKRLNSPHDAEDVFQNFCVKVLRHHGSIKSGERLDAWLAITLRHTLTDHYRRRATRIRGAEAYAIEAKILAPEKDEIDEPACSCVTEAMQQLDPAQAKLLTRLDLQDHPRITVATELGISLNALGVRVHRIRAKLKKQIAEFCPVCGDGQFMQCDCDHSGGIPSLPIQHPTELAAKL